MRAYVQDRGRDGKRARWRARYDGPDGRLRSKSFSRRVDADRWLAEQVVRLNRGEWVDPAAGQRRFGDWLAEWESSRVHLRDSTQARDRSLLRIVADQLGGLSLSAVSPADLRRMVSALSAAGKAPATVRKTYQLAAAALRAAARDHLIYRSPAEGIDLPSDRFREMAVLEPSHVHQLADEVGPLYAGMVLLGAYGGLRIGEAAGLTLDDFEPLRRRVTVTRSLSDVSGRVSLGAPKTAASRRSLLVPQAVVEELARLLAVRGPGPNGVIFTAAGGGLIRLSGWRKRVWHVAVKRTGLDGVRFHDLRHTHAAWLIADGAHPKAIQARLGHESITTTLNTYGHLMRGLDEQLVEGLERRIVEVGAPPARPQLPTEELYSLPL